MITFTVAAILGILLVIVLMQLFKKTPAPPPEAPVEDLANLKVTDARVGDALSIAGAGDRMTDLDFTVERGTRYEARAHGWSSRDPIRSGAWRCVRAEMRRSKRSCTPAPHASRSTLSDFRKTIW